MTHPACACPCHTKPGPGYDGHPSPGEVPPAGLVLGLVGSNGQVATLAPYCWTCAYAMVLRLARLHVSTQMNPAALDEAVQREIQAAREAVNEMLDTRAAVERMMRYAHEEGRE